MPPSAPGRVRERFRLARTAPGRPEGLRTEVFPMVFRSRGRARRTTVESRKIAKNAVLSLENRVRRRRASGQNRAKVARRASRKGFGDVNGLCERSGTLRGGCGSASDRFRTVLGRPGASRRCSGGAPGASSGVPGGPGRVPDASGERLWTDV